MNINKYAKKLDTESKLRDIRDESISKYKRLRRENKAELKRKAITLKIVRNAGRIEEVMSEIVQLLGLKTNPLTLAYNRRYNAFFGYKFVLHFVFGWLFDMVNT